MTSLHRLSAAFSLSAAAFLLPGCDERQPTPTASPPEAAAPPAPTSPAAARSAAAAVNAFTADLLPKVSKPGGNLFVSPYSIAVAVAMARAGAVGETATQIDAALHLPADAPAAFRSLTTALADVPTVVLDRRPGASEPAYELSVADGLFVQRGWPFRPGYRSTVVRDYAAEVREVDFADDAEGSRTEINRWVFEKTKTRIADIVRPADVDANTRLALANAIYFKAKWASRFVGPEGTLDFTTAGGASVKAKRLAKIGDWKYAETAQAQVLELPYRGDVASMVFVLPTSDRGLDALVSTMTPSRLAELTAGLRRVRVDLQLPRFTFTSELKVTSALRALGVVAATSRAADFTGIADEPLFISAVLHKAFIAVDEEGTEAAAATVVLISRGGDSASVDDVRFHANRPFLFFIRHVPTGAILFVGTVADPTKP